MPTGAGKIRDGTGMEKLAMAATALRSNGHGRMETATAARAVRAGRAGHGATGAAADPLILLKACARRLPTECSVPQIVRSL